MRGPPDPEMRSPAAANGRAKSQRHSQPHHPSDSAEDFQARKLRGLFSFCQATARTVANLAWGVAR